MKVHRLKHIRTEDVSRINSLLRTLSPDTPEISKGRLEELIADSSFSLFTAEEDGVISGMLSLTRCHTLAKSKYWIEDVIVDPAFRGKGTGHSLVQAAVLYVKEQKEPAAIYLTSNPSRTHARALYRSEGFEEYDTGVFLFKV
jgi:ribosomal protein S18 acetylase RimI-like enzyme